jgi:hypothetical protein
VESCDCGCELFQLDYAGVQVDAAPLAMCEIELGKVNNMPTCYDKLMANK